MKNLLFTLLLTCISIVTVDAQTTNAVRAYYGFTYSELIREELTGAPSYSQGNSYEFGFVYNRKINNNLSIETGANVLKTKFEITPAPTGEPIEKRIEKTSLVSIPVYLNYGIGKYFFVNGGLLVDLQEKQYAIDSQEGIGAGIGVGAKINFNNAFIFVNPNLKAHALVPFKKENHQQRLVQTSLQIGAGYTF